MVTYVKSTAAIYNLDEHLSIFWPRIKVTNPNKTVYGAADTITVPPCGHVAGVMARTDSSRPGGVYLQPAGVERGNACCSRTHVGVHDAADFWQEADAPLHELDGLLGGMLLAAVNANSAVAEDARGELHVRPAVFDLAKVQAVDLLVPNEITGRRRKRQMAAAPPHFVGGKAMEFVQIHCGRRDVPVHHAVVGVTAAAACGGAARLG